MIRLYLLLLLLLLAIASVNAQNYYFEFETYNAFTGDSIPIMHGDTAVPVGRLVQVIRPGTEPFLHPPLAGDSTAGMPGTGNILSSTFAIGTGCGIAGNFDVFLCAGSIDTSPAVIPTGSTFWARVWWNVNLRAVYGAAFQAMEYCEMGPFITPTATADPFGHGPQVGFAQAIPSSAHPTWHTLRGGTAVVNKSVIAIPKVYSLEPAYPNPFNSDISFLIGVPQNSGIRLLVFNMLGQKVATLHSGSMTAGYHRFEWNATGNASGSYFVKMEAPGVVKTQTIRYVR